MHVNNVEGICGDYYTDIVASPTLKGVFDLPPPKELY